MALDYDTWVSQLANLMVTSSDSAEFQIFLPGCRDYAEQRIYREMDLLATQITDASASTVADTRALTLPSAGGEFVVVDEVNIITPATAGVSSGTRVPCYPVSRAFIDAVYPSQIANTGVPISWAMEDQATIVFGPAPDAAYTVEIIGTFRPTPLSSGNPNTFLTDKLPDLFIAASMVFASGYQRDFGGQGADNPQMSVSWEKQYQTLFASASAEEMRKSYAGQAWGSKSATPAKPERA